LDYPTRHENHATRRKGEPRTHKMNRSFVEYTKNVRLD
jgi:hypothetical protein